MDPMTLSMILQAVGQAPRAYQAGKDAYGWLSGSGDENQESEKKQSENKKPSKGNSKKKYQGWLEDEEDEFIEKSPFTDQQRQALNMMLMQGLSGMQQASQPMDFQGMAQQARAQFQDETLPDIMRKYAGQRGAGRDTGMQRSVRRSAVDFEKQMQAQMMQQMMQERQRQAQMAQQMLAMGLKPQSEQILKRGRPNALREGLTQGVSKALPHTGNFIDLISKYGPQMLQYLQGSGGQEDNQQGDMQGISQQGLLQGLNSQIPINNGGM